MSFWNDISTIRLFDFFFDLVQIRLVQIRLIFHFSRIKIVDDSLIKAHQGLIVEKFKIVELSTFDLSRRKTFDYLRSLISIGEGLGLQCEHRAPMEAQHLSTDAAFEIRWSIKYFTRPKIIPPAYSNFGPYWIKSV